MAARESTSTRPSPPARPNSSDASPIITPKRALLSGLWTIGGRPVSVLSSSSANAEAVANWRRYRCVRRNTDAAYEDYQDPSHPSW